MQVAEERLLGDLGVAVLAVVGGQGGEGDIPLHRGRPALVLVD